MASFKIFDKTGTALNGVNGTTFNSLFSPLGPSTPCGANQNVGSGFVLYDHLADRWVVTDIAYNPSSGTGPFYQCIAVSKTSDPVAGGWWLYALQVDPSQPTWFGDVPKLALWPDAYYLSANLFANITTFQGVRVFALNRSAMINGTSAPNPGAIAFNILPAGLGSSASLLPATFRTGSAPPVGTPEYFMAIDFTSAGMVQTQVKTWRFHVDFAVPANSTFGVGANRTPNGTTTVAGFVNARATTGDRIVPQPGAAPPLYAGGDRLMTPLVYQNLGGTESLWVSHTVNNNQNGTGPTGIRWYQFNVTGGIIPATPVQQQTFTNASDGLWRWMPSLSVDALGNMAIGYSVSNTTLEPSIRYAGRLAGDPLNVLAQGEATLITGGGHQTSSSGHWGFYSATSVDPADNLTFWHTNEYYPATSSTAWSTRIGSFKVLQVTFTVTTTADHDDGTCDAIDCTLREAINASNAHADNNVVAFAPGVSGTIQLSSALPNLSTSMVLQGPGADVITVRRNTGGEYRIFTIGNGTTSGPTVKVSGLTLSNGNASGSFPANAGGGILNDHGNLTLNRVTLSGNVCSSPCNGGGIYNFGASSGNAQLAVSDSTLSNNNGGFAGGGIYNDGGNGGSANLSVRNTTFYFNAAGISGGGILNTASSGGVGNVTVTNCTFADNFGGIGEQSAGPFSVIVRNTIFKSSFGSSLTGNAGAIVSQGHNLSSDAAGGDGGTGPGGLLNGPGDKRNTNPQLDSAGPANNGGPTLTVALLSNSPAINMGDDTLAPTADQRGYGRTGVSDIGAFEFNGASPAPPVPTGAVSRKVHNGMPFDVPLPLAGSSGVECRSGGASGDYQIVVTFPSAVTFTGASVTAGAGSVASSSGGGSTTLTVNLTGVTSGQTTTVTLANVNDGMNVGNVSVPLGVLVGDTNGSRSVTATDVAQTKAQSGQPLSIANFRTDVNASGTINATDLAQVKAQAGTALP